MKVVISIEAEADMEGIADYIARSNPRRALSFVRELRARCFDLRSRPRTFPLVPRYEQHGIRRRVYGNYLIFFRIEDEQIVVLHILHGAMDYGVVLFSDDLPD